TSEAAAAASCPDARASAGHDCSAHAGLTGAAAVTSSTIMSRNVLGSLVAALATATAAHATFPYPAPPAGTPPQAYASYLRLPVTLPPTRPSDFTGGDAWKLTSDQSGDPAIDSNPAELFGVTGMSVDEAWQVSTGRPDVLIAVLDSGIR